MSDGKKNGDSAISEGVKNVMRAWKEEDCLSHPENCVPDCPVREECEKLSMEVF